MNRRSLFKIFLFRRRPKMGGISQHWRMPIEPGEFDQHLHWEGFVSDGDLPKVIPSDGPEPTLGPDLNDLRLHLLPTFFEHNQKARAFQNQFYVLHWVLLFGAALTVFWSVTALNAALTSDDLPFLVSVVFAAAAGGITAFYAASADENELQRSWAVNRRIAEELRSHYFRYLAHVSPYDKEDRQGVLIASVYSIQSKATNGNTSSADNRIQRGFPPRNPHNVDDLRFVLDFYARSRLNYQMDYYRARVDEAEVNSSFVGRAVFLLMMATVVMATASIWAWYSPKLIMLTLVTLLPCAALMLLGFRWLYGWERQATLYRDTIGALRRASAMVENSRSLPQTEQKVVLNRVVTTTEDAINAEVNQWGIFQGGLGHYQREGYLEVEPMFGIPPNEAAFHCDVFMIMPFDEEFDPIYTNHIEPFVRQELRLDIKRGDVFYSKHAIMREVWAAIYMSRLVLVECTTRNANVYYELGIAHTLGKPAVMITQKIEDIPFDLRHLRHIVYENSEEGMTALKNQLRHAIRAVQ